MNSREKLARIAQLLILEITRADREIDDYWRNFFNKENSQMIKNGSTCPNCHQDFLVLSPPTLTDPDFVHLRCLKCKHSFKRPKEDQPK